MRILIADDSRAMRLIVQRELRHAGLKDAEIVEAANGREALDMVISSPPDLILSDWNMPEMEGIELLREIRARGLDIPFGFITSETMPAMRAAAVAAGARFLIAKPIEPSSFAEVVRTLRG